MITKTMPALAALGLIMAACAPQTGIATPRSIELHGVNIFVSNEATAQAKSHCASFGRDAVLIPDNKRDGRVTFRCVDR